MDTPTPSTPIANLNSVFGTFLGLLREGHPPKDVGDVAASILPVLRRCADVENGCDIRARLHPAQPAPRVSWGEPVTGAASPETARAAVEGGKLTTRPVYQAGEEKGFLLIERNGRWSSWRHSARRPRKCNDTPLHVALAVFRQGEKHPTVCDIREDEYLISCDAEESPELVAAQGLVMALRPLVMEGGAL